jgi:hypothetical protein
VGHYAQALLLRKWGSNAEGALLLVASDDLFMAALGVDLTFLYPFTNINMWFFKWIYLNFVILDFLINIDED